MIERVYGFRVIWQFVVWDFEKEASRFPSEDRKVTYTIII